MNKSLRLLLNMFVFVFGVNALAAPGFMVVEGQLIDPSGHLPVEESNVSFLLEVLSPGPEECILYEESHTLNMTNSNGLFAIDLGQGLRTGTGFEDTSTIESAFSNSTGPVTPSVCVVGSNYSPTTTDHRKLRITFDKGNGPITIGQDVVIGANAYAMSAGSLNGLSPSELLQINIGAGFNLNQNNLEFVFANANWAELQALLDGSSASFSGGGAPAMDVDNNNQKIINVADPNPTTDSDATNVGYSRSYIGGQSVDTADLGALAAGNNGEVLTWNGTQWNSQIINDTNKLPLSGGTMTGPLNMGTQDIVNVNDLSIGNELSIAGGIGVGAGINSSGHINLKNQTELQLSEPIADGANYVSLRAPGNLASNVNFTLPPNDGNSGDVLQTDGSGILTWTGFGGGELNTASNVGTGEGLFYQKVGDNLEFKSLISGSPNLTITSSLSDITLIVDENSFNPILIPVGSTPLAATNLQDAINELETSKISTVRTIAAGNGLTGGGNLTTDRTFDIGGGAGIIINPDDISVQGGDGISVDSTSGVQVDIWGTTAEIIIDSLDELLIHDSSSGELRKMSRANFVLAENEVLSYVNNANTFISNDGNAFGVPLTIGTNDTNSLNLETNGISALSIDPSGRVGIGVTTPSAQLQIQQPLSGSTQLIQAFDSSSNEVFSVDDQGRTRSPGSFQFGSQGATCVDVGDIGQMRTNQAINALQVCIDMSGLVRWATIDDKRCPPGMDQVGDDPQAPHICISSTPATGSHGSAAGICQGNFPGSKLCSQNQMRQANAISSLTFATNAPHIVSDLVYDGGYGSVLVDANAQPTGVPIALNTPALSFHCCID